MTEPQAPQVPPPMNGHRQRDRTPSLTTLRALLALTVALAAVLVLPAIASAKHHRAKHHRAEPTVVASGTTLFGVPWQATVRNGQVQFSVDSRQRYSRGWVARTSLPSSAPAVFSSNFETNIDPRPEGELAGVTSTNVAMLQLHMSDGTIQELYPTLAPPAAVLRQPRLGGIRFFAGFFGSGQLPVTVTAMDAESNVLAERTSGDGNF